jgi:hypothetical protein
MGSVSLDFAEFYRGARGMSAFAASWSASAGRTAAEAASLIAALAG